MTEETPPPSGDTVAEAVNTNTPTANVDAVAPGTNSAPPPAKAPSENLVDEKKFSGVPDAYKDRAWASKIKTEDDLYKQIDNLTSLVGKKTIVPDLTKATESEREEYFSQMRPKSVDEYVFGDQTDPAIKTPIAESLMKNGVSAVQANAIIKDYQAAEQAYLAEQFKPEVIESTLQNTFGDKWKEITGKTRNSLKGFLDDADNALLDNLPNAYISVIYKTLGKVVDTFGVTEKDSHASAAAGRVNPVDISVTRETLRNQMAALKHRPHHISEMQALQKQLNETYSNDPRLQKKG